MGLETTTVITGLNETYPTTADAIQQGDDHIRLLKAVLKNCFPNVNAPLTASMVPNVPAGGIAATTLQAAINELDSEKVPLNGTGATGTWGISISGNANTATTATNATNSTNASAIADGAVSTTAKLADSIVTNAKLARAGTSGQMLYSAGTGGDPYWGAPPSGGVTSVNGNTGAVTAAQVAAAATSGYGFTPASNSLPVLSNAFVSFSSYQGSWDTTYGKYRSILRLTRNSGSYTDIDIGCLNT